MIYLYLVLRVCVALTTGWVNNNKTNVGVKYTEIYIICKTCNTRK